jgi:hypothetical protein
MRRNSSLAILAILISGCASSQPERVYVDLDRAVQAEQAPELQVAALPQPKAGALPVTVKQAGLPATSITDRTRERLVLAKQLVDENRGKSIASLSTMLKRVYLAQTEDEIANQNREELPQQDSIIADAFAGLRQVFEEYGTRRGPLLAPLNLLARSTSLAIHVVPANADALTKKNLTMANDLRRQILALDAQYNAQATELLAEAGEKLRVALARLDERAKQMRVAAESKAVAEAESKAAQTQTSMDVQIKQLVPESLPVVPPRQVVVPGSPTLPPPPTDTAKPIFGSLGERRHLLDQEIDIWIKSTGKTRSLTANGVRDATEGFLQWRSAHKVGP